MRWVRCGSGVVRCAGVVLWYGWLLLILMLMLLLLMLLMMLVLLLLLLLLPVAG